MITYDDILDWEMNRINPESIKELLEENEKLKKDVKKLQEYLDVIIKHTKYRGEGLNK